MSSILEIVMNQQIILQYAKNTRLPGKQRQFLDKMDYDMAGGINLGDKYYEHPDSKQKGEYVAMQLAHGIYNNDKGIINAMCAYLANRLPDLAQICINEDGENVSIDLHFNDSKSS